MLSTSAEPASTQFTRRDAGRLVAASAAARARDVGDPRARRPARRRSSSRWPSRPPPTSWRRAPIEYISDVLTEQAREAARADIDFQYDFTIARGASAAAQQVRELERKVAPIDAAFAEGVSAEDRATLLEEVLVGELGSDDRATLLALDAARWQAVRTEVVPGARHGRAQRAPRHRGRAHPRRRREPVRRRAHRGRDRARRGADPRRWSSPNSSFSHRAHGAGAEPRGRGASRTS